MTGQTNILIPLNNGSRHNDLELRYCLRSIEKYLSGVSRIIIIGEKPEFLNYQNITHLSFDDDTDNKQRAHNIYRKIIAGIENFTDLSDNFLFFNDDHFLLSNFEASEFPYLHRGEIKTHRIGSEPQRIQMENTVNHFPRNTSLFDFDVHCPIIYNKSKFKQIFCSLEWPEYGYGIKSMYCNSMIDTTNWAPCEDLKFKEPAMKETIYRMLEGRGWFSTGDRVLKSGGMQEVLSELYSSKSKYEA